MSSIHQPSLERLGLRAAQEEDRLLAHDDVDTDVVLAGVQRRQRRVRVRRAAFFAAASSLVLLLVAFFGVRRMTAAPVRIAHAPPALGPRQAETSDVPLAFADGSSVVVKRGTRADVREVRAHGAVVALERGTVDVHVVHTSETRWDVVAGPFDVHVTGTRFDASWDEKEKRLTVAMKEGSVQVTGPCVNERLAAPSTKTFACDEKNAKAANDRASDARASEPASPGPMVPAEPGTDVGSASHAANDGRAAKVDESATALFARGDAARLAGDTAKAQRLYLLVRERHPKSAEAAKAAFLLGRLAESSGSVGDAARWYEAVMRESPQSPYAQEALGRSLELAQRHGNATKARALADEYVKKYPNGPHRAYATSVLDPTRHDATSGVATPPTAPPTP